jgi:hypothetical protein
MQTAHSVPSSTELRKTTPRYAASYPFGWQSQSWSRPNVVFLELHHTTDRRVLFYGFRDLSVA